MPELQFAGAGVDCGFAIGFAFDPSAVAVIATANVTRNTALFTEKVPAANGYGLYYMHAYAETITARVTTIKRTQVEEIEGGVQ